MLLVINDVCCDLYMTDSPQQQKKFGCRRKYLLRIKKVLNSISEARTHLNVKLF